MSDGRDEVVVHLDAPELGGRRAVGTLSRERADAKSVISFAYGQEWLHASGSFAIDPMLMPYEGDQYLADLPGILTDAAPDRWGRVLQERREALMARREERRPRPLDDWDFLVGVNDETRMGALRVAHDGAFIDDEPLSVPPRARLRDLEYWARRVEEELPDEEGDRWIAMLVAPGSSLGGARPKASFVDDDGALWIAKFPSREDRHDVGGWEYVVSRLAARAGIEVPEGARMRLGSEYQVYCARRFDREGGDRRLYASAMTMVAKRDHEDASYLDLAKAVVDHCDPEAIEADLRQLFRRVVFNVLTANRDDHLRNHGFLRTRGGWRLAPAFDVNPLLDKREHSLAFDDAGRLPDVDLVLETAKHYRLDRATAETIVREVREVLGSWAEEAREAELSRDEVDRFAEAFEPA